ncbi:hypothetical protein BJ138DRAFT_1130240 [Hygrophoropsis aurantiaca]|uniref:Uncharacterized protein n=1 Tax=Hygrophoropsis aurantiaca TaxID=72124 RepID=A0ACB7ZYD6_9AGAM|nr:hypothetical protein BJ138DRAFT_1130240 [Hygrophoropsis aurantiaca]
MQRSTPPPLPQISPLHIHSAYDEHMSRRFPGHQPMSQDGLRHMFSVLGATDDTIHEYIASQNKFWDEMLGPGGKAKIYGLKPEPDDPTVRYYPIPNSLLAIPIWSGDMESLGHFSLDFVDTRTRAPLNAPAGYDIWHVYHPAVSVARGWQKLVTMNSVFNVSPSVAGQEIYAAPEGSLLQLLRPGEDPFYFEIPRRPATGRGGEVLEFAQPVVFCRCLSPFLLWSSRWWKREKDGEILTPG